MNFPACLTRPPFCVFAHRLEKHSFSEQILVIVNDILTHCGLVLKTGTVGNATFIASPTSTKNKNKSCDPEMHLSKKGNQWYFGMKAHIGVDTASGLVHTVCGTWGNVSDIAQAYNLLHGQQSLAFGDAGYQGVDKRADAKVDVIRPIAMRPGKRRALNKDNAGDALIGQAEKLKASVRAKVEHAFRVVKRQFEYVKVCYRGLKKNMAQLFTLFALSNLWMVRSNLMGARA